MKSRYKAVLELDGRPQYQSCPTSCTCSRLLCQNCLLRSFKVPLTLQKAVEHPPANVMLHPVSHGTRELCDVTPLVVSRRMEKGVRGERLSGGKEEGRQT